MEEHKHSWSRLNKITSGDRTIGTSECQCKAIRIVITEIIKPANNGGNLYTKNNTTARELTDRLILLAFISASNKSPKSSKNTISATLYDIFQEYQEMLKKAGIVVRGNVIENVSQRMLRLGFEYLDPTEFDLPYVFTIDTDAHTFSFEPENFADSMRYRKNRVFLRSLLEEFKIETPLSKRLQTEYDKLGRNTIMFHTIINYLARKIIKEKGSKIPREEFEEYLQSISGLLITKESVSLDLDECARDSGILILNSGFVSTCDADRVIDGRNDIKGNTIVDFHRKVK